MDKKEEQRTKAQNRALHKFFELLAEELNNAGFDMRKGLRSDIDIPWGKETIKEYIWRPVQEAQLTKKSTTELTTKEIDKVYETLNRFLAERYKIHIPFPSWEHFLDEKEGKKSG